MALQWGQNSHSWVAFCTVLHKCHPFSQQTIVDRALGSWTQCRKHETDSSYIRIPLGEASDHPRQCLLPYQVRNWCVRKHPGKAVNFEDNDNKQRISSKSFPLHITPQTWYIAQHLNKKTNKTMELPEFSNFLLLPWKVTIFFHGGGGRRFM